LTPTGKLFDELTALVAKSADYQAHKEAAAAQLELDRDLRNRQNGINNANDSIPYFTTSIKTYATEGYRSYDIRLQQHSKEYNLDTEETAYAQTLVDHYRNEGLTVEWKRELHPPCRGSYVSFDEQRYSASLILTW
jgi:hypothetical protein